jgi:hypothetical protein
MVIIAYYTEKTVVRVLIVPRNCVRGNEDMSGSFLKVNTLKMYPFAIEVETCKTFARVLSAESDQSTRRTNGVCRWAWSVSKLRQILSHVPA